jgi:nicotinamidase-related amidase
MGSWWTRYLIDGDPGADLAAGLEPLGRAWVLRKEHYSAFRRTRLESWLRSRGVTDLVLAGVMTHICVDTTARDAFMRGFNVVVVYDACASKDALLHAASLTSLSHAVARVCATRQVTAALAKVKS